MRREKAGRPQSFPLPGRSGGSYERRRFSPWVGKTPRRRAWRPPQGSCLENPRTEGLCPQRRTRSTDATWRAHTPQNQSPHPTAVDKTPAPACLSTSYYCNATEYREIWTQYSALQISRDGGPTCRPACRPACLPPPGTGGLATSGRSRERTLKDFLILSWRGGKTKRSW